MKKIPTMSFADRQDLMDAVEKASELSLSGECSPSEALAKCASEAKIPVGRVPLMVQSYNIARVETQRKSSDDPAEKSAGVDLADVDEVKRLMFPENLPTPAAAEKAAAVSADYFGAPDWRTSNRRSSPAPVVDKMAADTPPGDVVPRFEPGVWKRAVAVAERGRAALAAMEQQQHDRLEEMRRKFEKLSQYFRTQGSVPFGEFSDSIGRLYGEAGAAVSRHLERSDPEMLRLRKKSSRLPEPARMDREPYLSAAACIKGAEDYQAGERALAQATAELKKAAVKALSDAGIVCDYHLPPADGVMEPSAEKRAGFNDTALGMVLGGLYRDIPRRAAERTEEDKAKVLDQITDPAHEMKIRDIQAEANLADTLSRNPHLKAEDPAMIADSYNDLSVLAPRAANQPLILQHVLSDRAATRGTPMAPDQVDKIMDVEDRLKDRDPRGGPTPTGGVM